MSMRRHLMTLEVAGVRRFQILRRTSLALAVLVAAVMSTVPGAGGSPREEGLALKKVGDELFWDGVVIESAQVADDALCDVVAPCYEYRVRVPESSPGVALLIGFTATLPDMGSVRPWADSLAKSPEMHFEVQLYEPGTQPSTHEPRERKENGAGGLHGYSAEFIIGGVDGNGNPLAAPRAGTWTLRVVPMSVVNMGFRMRAGLKLATPLPEGPQLPDLRLNPPFELTFGSTPGSFQPGVTAAYDGPHVSCMAEEIEEAAQEGLPVPQLCLRFSMGLENVGVGNFELAWQRSADEATAVAQFAGVVPKPHRQRVCDFLGRLDSCSLEPDVGIKTSFHASHFHEHWKDAWSIRLLRVNDDKWDLRGPAPKMTRMGEARKLGINPADELIADWDRFWLGSRVAPGDNSGCFADTGGTCGIPVRLRAGWADLYEWNRGGNYVEFPQAQPLTPEPGFYVLQGEIDPRGLVTESNEANNRSYALFEVTSGGRVKLLERGYGTNPWDNKKTISLVSP